MKEILSKIEMKYSMCCSLFRTKYQKVREFLENVSIIVRSWIIFALITLIIIIYSPITSSILVIIRASTAAHFKSRYIVCCIALGILKYIGRVSLEITGSLPKEPCVIMSTHQSTIDTGVLTIICPDAFFVAKKLLKIFFTNAQGFYYIDRSLPSSLMSLIRTAKQIISNGRSIIIFAEGTRKPYGKPISILPSMSCLYSPNVTNKIVPVYVRTGNVSPKKSDTLIKPGKIVVDILPPIIVDTSVMSAKEFVVHIENKLNDARLRRGDVV